MLKIIKLTWKCVCSSRTWRILPLVAFFLLFFFTCDTSYAHEPSYKNTYVKAAYIFKLTDFVNWPAPQKTNNICILGSDVIGVALAQIQRSSTELEKWDIIQKYITSSFDECQVLFLGTEEEGNIEQILFSIKDKPILTVSDKQNFIESGGIIGFVSQNRKIKIEANKAQSAQQGVSLSSKLMSVSIRIIQ